ncbi:hypothetical protein C0993_012435 [Termitomyces sp. T159_Od127]|nr:hypothetical protein C0993_012435 [Termitomyces sp. T159_Od127]
MASYSPSTSGSITGSPTATSGDQSDVPSSVRRLLLSTKHLQELLKQWSLSQATETQVSDAYVQIGNDFNATVRAFAHHQIDLRFV